MDADNVVRASRGMSRAQLLALPVVIDLDTANRALSLGRSTGYQLAKRGVYPCKVLRLGSSYRVVTADLLRLLDVEGESVAGVGRDPDEVDGRLCA